MRALLVIAVAGCLGVVLGWSVSNARHRGVTNVFGPEGGVAEQAPPLDAQPRPVMTLLDGTVHRFGRMERGSTGSCSFRIRNDGNARLTLKVLKASCKCTRAEMLKPYLDPGETTRFVLEWKGVLGGPDPEFRQEAPVITNDPDHARTMFSIEGELFFAVETVPSELVLGNIRSKEAHENEVTILCHTRDDIEVAEITQQSKVLAEYVDVEVVPRDHTAVLAETGARSAVTLNVTVKPGLPPGQFSQEVYIRTNLADATVTLPITGQVTSEISLLGPKYSTKTNLLNIGTVDGEAGHETKLLMLIKGEHYDKTQVHVSKVDPESHLQIEVGEASIGQNNLTRVPLYVRIPPGSLPVNRLGTEQAKVGVVDLETTHPRIKRMQFWVRFAVE